MKSLLLLAISFLSISCATYKVPKFNAYITLPASEDGYAISTIGHEEKRVPAPEWAELRKHGITLLGEDWFVLRTTIKQNCHMQQCEQLTGYFDQLFLTIDGALKKIP